MWVQQKAKQHKKLLKWSLE
ncbi:hypothetical protein ACHAW6_003233 [Cyclotella cf. meneghiniana]